MFSENTLSGRVKNQKIGGFSKNKNILYKRIFPFSVITVICPPNFKGAYGL
jgi:hypothetical protein